MLGVFVVFLAAQVLQAGLAEGVSAEQSPRLVVHFVADGALQLRGNYRLEELSGKPLALHT